MTSCDQIKELIGPFDDGELQSHEMEEVAFHVVSCKECKAILEDYRALGVNLRAAIVYPAIDGFSAAVQARISGLSAPLRTRIAQALEAFGERFGGALALGVAAAAAAILTFIVVAPGVSQLVHNAQHRDATLADAAPATPQVMARTSADDDPALLVHQAERDAVEGSQALVERLEADSPSVALWNEPKTDTTVIWVADQQP